MTTIIFATENQGKLREARQIFADMDVEIVSMSEAGIHTDVDENGETFAENALIKVRAARPFTDAVIVADDSGLMIDAFDGKPGVHSARWLGHDTPYDIKNAKVLEMLEGKTGDERAARYVCAIAASLPDGREISTLGTMEGEIAYEPAGDGGFGYDPIFMVKEYGRTSAELTADEKNAISHRGKALEELKAELKKVLGAF